MQEASMQGKICLITGATNGHGRAAAAALAQLGAEVILLGRSNERLAATQQQIARQSGRSPRLLRCDLSSRREIDRAAAELLSWDLPLHVLLNNAGIVNQRRQETVDGLEATFAVNYLAHVQLTLRLIERLKQSAPARVINVSSDTHKIVSLDLDDLQLRRRYGFMRAYGRSKLAIVYFTQELARRLHGSGVTVNAVDPGPVDSGLALNNEGLASAAVRLLYRWFFPSPEQACRTAVQLASAPELEGVSGGYFKWGKRRTPRVDRRDATLGVRLWQASTQLTGVDLELERVG